MRRKLSKISSVLIVFVIFLNYIVVIIPRDEHHSRGVCHCSENCGCGCKGKVSFNFMSSVCIDAEGCMCKKGKNNSELPIKEGIVTVEGIYIYFPAYFLPSFPDNLNQPLNQVCVFHPPEDLSPTYSVS